MSLAAASSRVAYVLLADAQVIALGMSRKASYGPDTARSYAAQQIEDNRPDVVITEKVLKGSRKGPRTRAIIAAMTSVADVADVMSIEVVRAQSHADRFEEARDLARRYPALHAYLRSARKPWDPEPKTLIYFEALSLFEAAFGKSASQVKRGN